MNYFNNLIMSRVTLAQVETFYWIARLGSFHQAAARLNLSQPTISLRIRQLEAVIGVPLFERQGHHIQLSEHGQELLELAQDLILLSKKIETRFAPVRGSRGVVRLGLPESVAVTCLSSIIQSAAELAPLLQLEVTVDLSNVINRKLLNLSLDVAILADPEVGPPIKLTPIGQNPLAWLSSPDLAPPAEVTPEELAKFRILTTPELSHPSAVVTEWFATTGVQPSRVSICNNLLMIARMITDGVGVGVLPLALVQNELVSGSLVRLCCKPPLRNRTLQAAYHTQGTNAASHAVEAVVHVARQVLSSKFPLLPVDLAKQSHLAKVEG